MSDSSPPLQQDVHLIDYLRVVHKRKWFVVVVVLAALGGAAFQTLRTTPVYQSTGRIMVDNEMTIVEFPGIQNRGLLRLDTEMHIVRSREVVEHAVLNKLQTVESREDPGFEAQVNRLIGSTAVKQLPSTLILELSCRAHSPREAQQVCDAIAESYTDLNFEARKQVYLAGATAIQDQIRKAERDLELAESEFMQFKSEAGILSERRKNLDQEQVLGLTRKAKLDASLKYDEATNKYRSLKKWYESDDLSYLSPEIAPNSPANGLYDDILRKKSDIGSLAEVYTAKHPKLVAARAELRRMESQFDAEIQNTLNRLKREAEYYASNEAAHAIRVESEKRQQLRQNELDWQYKLYERQVATKEDILKTLRQKLEEVNVATSIVRNNVRIIERPQYLPSPIRPRVRFNLIIGLAFGLGLGLLGAFFLEYLDKSLKTPDDIDRYLGLPVLAVIPKVRGELMGGGYRPELPPGEATT